MTNRELEVLALSIRKRIIKMAYECNSNVHLGGALSMVDILAVLYGDVLRNVGGSYEERDKFILSKGHGALALFATLGEKGMISEERLHTYLADGSNLCAHPVMEPEIGIESSNGSLGQGIPWQSVWHFLQSARIEKIRFIQLLEMEKVTRGWCGKRLHQHHNFS